MSEYYSQNAIYDRVFNAVRAVNPNVYVAGIYNPSPSKFPAVFCCEIGHFSPIQNVTLMNDDIQYQSTFEIQVVSNNTETRKTEAYQLLDAAKTAFKELFFVEISEAPISISDPTKYRIMARFRRTIGGGDTMPESN